MGSDFFNAISVGWLDLKNFADEMAAIGGEELGDLEIASQDLLVEIGSLWVFKGKKSADHRVKDNAAAPDVSE